MTHPVHSENRTRTKQLQRRSFEQTCNVIRAYPKRRWLDEASRLTWRELVKAATSSRCNLEEADTASSDADFLAKIRIALREAKEAHVAIRIIVACGLAGHQDVAAFEDEANQLASILFAIVKHKAARTAARRDRVLNS
jgi:four helix bundle protein